MRHAKNSHFAAPVEIERPASPARPLYSPHAPLSLRRPGAGFQTDPLGHPGVVGVGGSPCDAWRVCARRERKRATGALVRASLSPRFFVCQAIGETKERKKTPGSINTPAASTRTHPPQHTHSPRTHTHTHTHTHASKHTHNRTPRTPHTQFVHQGTGKSRREGGALTHHPKGEKKTRPPTSPHRPSSPTSLSLFSSLSLLTTPSARPSPTGASAGRTSPATPLGGRGRPPPAGRPRPTRAGTRPAA